jgi:hypothetical protein
MFLLGSVTPKRCLCYAFNLRKETFRGFFELVIILLDTAKFRWPRGHTNLLKIMIQKSRLCSNSFSSVSYTQRTKSQVGSIFLLECLLASPVRILL